MTEGQKQILINIGINEEDFQKYYFSEDKKLFTPLKDAKGKIIKTGEQAYNEDFLNPPVPQPSQEEILRADLLKDNITFKLQLAQQQKINVNLLTLGTLNFKCKNLLIFLYIREFVLRF